MIPKKIYVAASLFNRLIEERNRTGSARLGLLAANLVGVCVDWIELEKSEEGGCDYMPRIEDEDNVRTYTQISRRRPAQTVIGFGYLGNDDSVGQISKASDIGGDLWRHNNVPFVTFTPEVTTAEMYDKPNDELIEIEVAVVDDKYKQPPKKKRNKATKTTLAKARSKRKTNKTKVHK